MTDNLPPDPNPSPPLDPLVERIVCAAVPGARILRGRVLGADDAAAAEQTVKGAGYGVPLRIDVELDGKAQSYVLHGTSENPFGHDRRADRAAELLLAADTFGRIPRHSRVIDVGAFLKTGGSVSLTDSGEFYLLTDYVEGHRYADDLRRIAHGGRADASDLARVDRLVDYLLALHTPALENAAAYPRALRDLLGSGEGIFGIVDAYALDSPGASAARLARLESLCLDWRWKLKAKEARPCRIHGDFHPFNILFNGEGELFVLDTSRGSVGDAADDVACLAVNFVFFALDREGTWQAAFRALWQRFWSRYLERSSDPRLLEVVAPFLTWRLLVVACPVWYPSLPAAARARLLAFAEAALTQDRFDPTLADEVFR